MKRSALFLVAVVVVACGPAFIAPSVTPQLVAVGKAKWADTTTESMQRGHDTFVASCGRGGFCHRLPDPSGVVAEKWPRIVPRMGKKAHLDEAQQRDVLRFILAVRDVPASAAAPGAAPASAPAPAQ